MGHKHKPKAPPQEEESAEGAPLWIISFADMMSLLMAFFVMLSTFSSFGPAEALKLRKAMTAALSPNFYGGWYSFHPRTAVGPQAIAAGQHEKGSERPTLEETQGKGLLAESKPEDFRTRKVFAIESAKVFWGGGATLSGNGRDFLDALAAFAAKMPGRIVIAENGPGANAELGLNRALRTLNYLAARGVAKDRCCIGTQGTLAGQNSGSERMLEIAILDESTYK
jgi:outer membrane protein OmpA-like peptidoglycan-associated protein